MLALLNLQRNKHSPLLGRRLIITIVFIVGTFNRIVVNVARCSMGISCLFTLSLGSNSTNQACILIVHLVDDPKQFDQVHHALVHRDASLRIVAAYNTTVSVRLLQRVKHAMEFVCQLLRL